MTSNRYLLTVATLIGVAAGSIGTGQLMAQTGVPETRTVPVSLEISPAQAGNTTGVQKAVSGCALVEAKYPGATCSISSVKRYCVTIDEDAYADGAYFEMWAQVDGEFVAGGAQ